MAGHRDYPSGRDGVEASRSPIFFNESIISGGLSYGSQNTSTAAPPAYADSVDRFLRFRLTMMLLI